MEIFQLLQIMTQSMPGEKSKLGFTVTEFEATARGEVNPTQSHGQRMWDFPGIHAVDV